MHKFFPAVIMACSALLGSNLLFAADTASSNYAERPEGKRLIDELVAEGLDRDHVTTLLAGAKRQQKILDATRSSTSHPSPSPSRRPRP